MICHQRRIRDALMLENPRPIQSSLDGCEVVSISKQAAEEIILTYEWLGTMPKVGRAYYGLHTRDGLAGVACFGQGMGTAAKHLCGEENQHLAICLERGACVHWAHPHAASFLISRACKLAAKDHGWRIFYAYSDQEAGEVGTVYQACNWLYIGKAAGRGRSDYRSVYIKPDGTEISSRTLRAWRKRNGNISLSELYEQGWSRRRHYDKGRYVNFEGDRRERKLLRKALRYPLQPYPKREG